VPYPKKRRLLSRGRPRKGRRLALRLQRPFAAGDKANIRKSAASGDFF
jgi:hypothetical protein